ncbi:acid-sensing ion channel 2-like [Stylophora pistillata]|uniref:acid-sensing ion channel 2-like n=1 Tax=Stylophora pistillata TaxID=50429 RepID=UPI000C047A93|nr:acid-sensing ion channel 2-like [Stylophora pistillata]
MDPGLTKAELGGTEYPKRGKSYEVNPISDDRAARGSSQKEAIEKTWKTYVESTTLHGLHYVFSRSTSARRFLWAGLLLLAMMWFSFQSFKLVEKYYSYKVTTKVSLRYEPMQNFPAVTICNSNMFKHSVVKAKAYEEIVPHLFVSISEKMGLPLSFNDSIDLNKYNDFNLTQFYIDAGHQITDTVFHCIWNGKPTCGHRNFTSVLTSMGLCHTFNSGRDGQRILQVKQAGSDRGLHLILNVKQREYYGITSYLAGLKVLIHDQQTLPLVSRLGFAVSPGTSTFVALKKLRILNLPKPYEGNCHDKEIKSIPGFSKYTIPSCEAVCLTNFVIDKCGCRDALMPDINNTKVCGLREIKNCQAKQTKVLFLLSGNFHKGIENQCDCPVPCDSISFNSMLSYAAFPSNNFLASLAEELGVSNTTADLLKEEQEITSQNLLELRVYFQDLNYQVIEEIPAYEYESLLGEIGGQVGLCVGASLLTVLEFFDVIIAIVGIRLGFR